MTAPADWKPMKLDELGFVGRGKSRHRPRNAAFLYGGPYPFFQTGDIKAANFYLTEFAQTYSEEGLAQSKLWKPGTLCITIAANIAESAILGIEGCFPDSVVGFVADPDKADIRFIKYHMEILKLQMQGISRGTTQDNLSLDKLLTFDFHVPPLPIQRRIAGILSAYDDLIENCQRRIKILEAMARALYREWFVAFRFPGHEGHPRVPSPLGEIPKGWEARKVGDVLELNYGKALKKEDRREGPYPVYGSSGCVGTHDAAMVDGPGIIVGRKGNVGSVFWSEEDFFVIDTAYYVTSQLSLRYIYYVLPTLNFINSDAAVPGLNRNQAYALEMLVPPSTVIEQFCELANAFEQQAANFNCQIENLRRTRDLLLPRLLSGQCDVSSGVPEEGLILAVEQASTASKPVSPLAAAPPPPPAPEASAPNREALEHEALLASIRQLFSDGTSRDWDTALRDLAQSLGFRRLGKRIKEGLSSALLIAVRRGILRNDQGAYALAFRSVEDCTRDSLKDDFLSSMGRSWNTRTEAVQSFARFLGFSRVGHVLDDTSRSLINGLIREGRLETDGPDRIRRT